MSLCFLAGLLVRLVYSQEEADPVALACNQYPNSSEGLNPVLPDSQYLVTEDYGWFDRTHFNTGRPEQLLHDVQTALTNEGGLIIIQQGVHDGVLGYSAVYRVAGQAGETDPTAIALGIYLDWSIRFEEWQAQLPHLLMAPRTAFAVEDLPSQYLGFFAQSHEMTVAELFACYLGGVSGAEESPPDFVKSEKTAAIDGWAGIARLQNKTFMPMVETQSGWQHVAWPKPMQMEPVASGVDTWQFISETTWYFGATSPDILKANVRLHPYNFHTRRFR